MNIDFNNFATELLIIAGFVTAVGGAIAVIKKWINNSKPSQHEKIIKEQGEEIKKLDGRVTVLESSNRKQDRYVEAMSAAMLALLDHNINGNSIDKLKEARETMQNFLIHRG